MGVCTDCSNLTGVHGVGDRVRGPSLAKESRKVLLTKELIFSDNLVSEEEPAI